MFALRKTFSGFVLFVFFLSACVGSTKSVTPTAPAHITETPSAQETPTRAVSRLNVDVEALRGKQIKVWHPWFGAQASLFESHVAEFNKTNPWGIHVVAESQENFSELYQRTTDALDESTNPQVAIALPEHALGWKDKVADLNPYLHDPDYGMSALEISDFSNAVWRQDEVDEFRYGLPAQRTARFILYNETWARELGFDAAPKTSSEFEAQACAAHAAVGKDADPNNDALGGWLIDTHPITALSWMLAFDGGAQEQAGYRFLTPGNIAAFKFLKILQQKNCAWVASADLTTYDRFAARQALFATASLEELSDQSRAFFTLGNPDEWTVLPFPGATREAFVVYGSSYVMFKSDDATQLASWLFMRWALTPEVQARWSQSAGFFPLNSATMDLLGEYAATHTQWAEAVQLLSRGEIAPQLASWRTVRVMLGDAFADMFDTIRHPDLTDGQVPGVLKQMDDAATELNR